MDQNILIEQSTFLSFKISQILSNYHAYQTNLLQYLLHLTPTSLLHWLSGLVGIDDKHEVKQNSFPEQFKLLLNHIVSVISPNDDIFSVA